MNTLEIDPCADDPCNETNSVCEAKGLHHKCVCKLGFEHVEGSKRKECQGMKITYEISLPIQAFHYHNFAFICLRFYLYS